MNTTEQPFTTTAYGLTLTGTATWSGWTPDEATKQTIATLDAAKAKRASLRCMRAAQNAIESAHDRMAADKARTTAAQLVTAANKTLALAEAGTIPGLTAADIENIRTALTNAEAQAA